PDLNGRRSAGGHPAAGHGHRNTEHECHEAAAHQVPDPRLAQTHGPGHPAAVPSAGQGAGHSRTAARKAHGAAIARTGEVRPGCGGGRIQPRRQLSLTMRLIQGKRMMVRAAASRTSRSRLYWTSSSGENATNAVRRTTATMATRLRKISMVVMARPKAPMVG